MRSDHADPELLTEVRLDLTLGGRRLEITRIPEQLRPKKRGTGWTPEKAQTLLREWTADAGEGVPGWRGSSRSHQETGEEILRLVGMSREQFCQVVLLPQGEFARFLKADATQRGELLGKLFDTARFGRVEGWLAEQRRQQEASVQAGRRRLRELVSRTEQAAGPLAEPAADWIPAEGESDGALAAAALGWAALVRGGAAEQLTVAGEALAGAERRHRTAQQGLSRTEELARRQHRHREAVHRASLMDRTERQDADDRRRLTLAQAAVGVESALRLRASAASGYQRARAEEEQQRHRLAALPDPTVDPAADPRELAAAEAAVRAATGRLEAAAADERRCADLAAVQATEAAERRRAEELAEEADHWLTGSQAEGEALRQQEAEAREAAARAEQLDGRRADAEQRLAAARLRDELRARAEQADCALLGLERTALDAREHTLDLRRRRLDGMAAELAGRLLHGEACRVCGCTEHPAPALPSGALVRPADEEAAAAAQLAAEQRLASARNQVAELRLRAATATGTAGEEPVGTLAERLAGLTEQHRAAQHAAERLIDLQQQRERLERGQVHYTGQLHESRERVAAHTARLEERAAERAELTQRVAAARGDAPSVAERKARLDRLAERLSTVVIAARATEEAAARLKGADDELALAAVAAGFDTPQEAEAVRLPPAEQAVLRHRLEQRAAERAALARELADPELTLAAEQSPADLTAAQQALRATIDGLRMASSTADAARARCGELARLGGQLTGLAAELAPLLVEYGRINRLAQLAAGTGGDNRLKMRLESYVLAARLEQVAAAASARLVRMSGGRYTLVHSGERTGGGRRSGLSLLVVDAWTGTERDTATLSGGESFFASLALALGLADVVTDEAGGMPLDTLFIDEGFGTLDDQALEEVMDVLDGLRERDRAVGIVSHVADLRQRIPSQLLVRKGRHGSTLQLTGPEAG